MPLGSAVGLPSLVTQGGTSLAPRRTWPLCLRPLESAEGLPPTVTRGGTGLPSKRAWAYVQRVQTPDKRPHHQGYAGTSQSMGPCI